MKDFTKNTGTGPSGGAGATLRLIWRAHRAGATLHRPQHQARATRHIHCTFLARHENAPPNLKSQEARRSRAARHVPACLSGTIIRRCRTRLRGDPDRA